MHMQNTMNMQSTHYTLYTLLRALNTHYNSGQDSLPLLKWKPQLELSSFIPPTSLPILIHIPRDPLVMEEVFSKEFMMHYPYLFSRMTKNIFSSDFKMIPKIFDGFKRQLSKFLDFLKKLCLPYKSTARVCGRFCGGCLHSAGSFDAR